jgi:hypothetical protein
MRVVVMLRDPVFATWSRQRMYRRMQCGCDDFDLASWMGSKQGPAWTSNLQPDFNVRICDSFDASSLAVLRELDESNRFVQKSAESTSM